MKDEFSVLQANGIPFSVITPDGPDATVMELLNRGAKGAHITIMRKVNGEMVNDVHLKASSIRNQLRQWNEKGRLDTDSYYSVNSFYQARRGIEFARNINACYVDLDVKNCGNPNADGPWLVGKLIEGATRGDFPMPSIIKLSGVGAWALWIVHDPKNPAMPLPAFPEKLTQYAAIQGKINRTFQALGSDASATDFSRITRIEGSVNSKSDSKVAYAVILGDDGKPRSYTFDELRTGFGVSVEPAKWVGKPWTKGGDEKAVVRGIRGYRARFRNLLWDLELLRMLRGGFWEGHRYNACYIYSEAMRHAGFSECERELCIRQISGSCLDDQGASILPLFGRQVEDALRRRITRLSNEFVSSVLHIRPYEAMYLRSLKAAKQFRTVEIPSLTANEKFERRLKALLSLPKVPTVTEAGKLFVELGIPCSRGSVWKLVKEAKARVNYKLPSLFFSLSLALSLYGRKLNA